MNTEDFGEFVMGEFGGVTHDHSWESNPTYTVYRHSDNKKWLALVFDATKEQLIKLKPEDNTVLEYADGERIDVVNLKLDPEMIEDVIKTPGIFPAFHMNRRYWVTVILDGTVDAETLAPLIEMSYNLTMRKVATSTQKL